MKKTIITLLISATFGAHADNVTNNITTPKPATITALENGLIREEWHPEPMTPGNNRVDEIIEWNKAHPGIMPPLTEQEKYELFTKNGMPLPGTGAHAVASKELKFTAQQKSLIKSFNKDQKTKGYFEKPNKRASQLLKMPEIAENEFNERRFLPISAEDSHLRQNIMDLPIAYSYKGIPVNAASNIIGYAPTQTFIDGKWTGAVVFFESHFNAICAYNEVNIQLTQSAAYIPQEVVTYDVNNKITTINAVGDEDTGYIYEVEWWDNQFKRVLECASLHYTDTMRNETIELAKDIDRY